jgi:putative CocE/NonD family hydrolase
MQFPSALSGVSTRATPSLAAIACAGLSLGIGSSAFADVTCQLEYAVMRDGVGLATEVYLPSQGGRFPVILQRTPYNRNGAPIDVSCANPVLMDMAAKGYAVLNQDVRGIYRSEGDFHPMQQEVHDGYDAVEWAAAQPWSTGKVGMMSGSYVGLTQWQAADRSPPHLAAIAPQVTASDYHDHWTYVEGAFDLWFAQSWIHVTFGPEILLRDLLAAGMSRDKANEQVARFVKAGTKNLLDDWVWQLPLQSFPAYMEIAPYYYEWLRHPDYDAYWRRLDIEHRYDNVKVPTLNGGAWYDIFQVGTVRNFLGMKAEGGTSEARAGSKLVMTCCGHAGTSGTIQYDPAPTPITDQIRFFDHYLKGMDNGVEKDPAVQLWVLNPPDKGVQGSGFWVNSDVWPLKGTQELSLFLASDGHANTSAGDGRLTLLPEPSAPPDRFAYDPEDPVPTAGGNLCCEPALLPAGAHDQSMLEKRNDVLVYTSDTLTQDVAVIGPVKVVLFAASSARDTDFTAKLVDVQPDGFAANILDRIQPARFREGSRLPPSLITPGKVYEYTIELGNAGLVFRKGHKIRVEISSSNFPHYARNLNTGLDNSTTSLMAVAHQTVFHERHEASRVVLPVVPGIAPPDRK